MPLITPEYLIRIFLVFVRIGAMLSAAPFFGHKSIPVRIRILISFLMAVILVGFVPPGLPAGATTTLGMTLGVMVEALTGLVMGFAASFIFGSVHFAGETLGFQMGLSMAQAYDPMNAETSNPMGAMLSLALLQCFLLLDGHHHLLRALVQSFKVVPLAGAHVSIAGPMMAQWMGDFFGVALRLAAPFMVTFFLVDGALGIFARVVPQADIFSIGLPLKMLVGIGMMVFFLQNFIPYIPQLIDSADTNMMKLIEALAR